MVAVQIYFQPGGNQGLTLDDDGVQGGIFDLTTDQYWGMLIASFVLFGDQGNNIISIAEVRNAGKPNQSLVPVRLGYLAYALGSYILAYDSVYRPNRPRTTWNEYVHSFQRHVPEHVPADTSDYTGHLIGKGEALVKFKSLDFLQGILTIMNWFGLDFKDYFFEFYQNGVEMTL
jgi:hypothetical protein